MAKSKRLPVKPLPSEIVEQIFSRVDPKSLLRFRYVSKSWYATISGPNFTLKHSKQRLVFLFTPRKLSATDVDEDRLHLASVRKHGNLDTIRVMSTDKIDPPYLFSPDSVRVLSSYKGLFLFMYHTSLYLLNPMTRRCEKVLTSPYHEEKLAAGGICYDRSSDDDDYKVVVVDGSTLPMTVQVASLKTKQWKEVQFPYKLLGWGSGGAIVNDKLHWLIEKDGPGGGLMRKFKAVTCFDAEGNRFNEFPMPPRASRDNGAYMTGVTVVGGRLALSSTFNYNKGIDLWVMKEYGVEESWSLLYSVGMIDHYLMSTLPIVEGGKTFVACFADGKVYTRYQKEDDDGREEYSLDTAIPYEQSMFFPNGTFT